MKLTKPTIEFLKNFASINQNLWVEAGNKLNTMSVAKNIVASVEVQETFPSSFGVYNLNEFLGAISLFTDPDIEFGEKAITVKEGKTKLKFYYAEKEVLTYPKSTLKIPSVDVEFVLTKDQLQSLQKSASVLACQDLSFIGDGKTILAQIGDVKSATANTVAIEVGETDKVFNVFMKVENLKMVPGDYRVQLSSKRISLFINETKDLDYTMFVALEQNSTFG